MIKGFRQYTEQKLKPVVFTFGRFNPPTTGHLKLLDKVASIAKGNNYKVYASQSNNPKKDPLQYKEKIGFMRKMFPKHGRNIVMSPKIKTVFDIASELYDEGFNKIIMVVGGDRVKEFDSLLKKYNGVKGRHGFYNFVEGIEVVSAGERDPDAEGVTGMSASKMRKAAVDGDFKSFQNGLPKGYSDGTKLFNTLRKRMGIKEITNFRKHVQLDTISEKRERYSRGEIFNIGEEVFTESGKLIIIEEKKPNYVVDTDGNKYWINDLQEARKVAQDKDVGKKKGTQPKKYYTGLAKSTKSKRDAHFKKGAKMDDDNPAAYKPAPGDSKGKTRPSKHTQKFKKMFGEVDEDLSANDIRDWALLPETIEMFKDKYQTDWKIELDNTVAEMLEDISIDETATAAIKKKAEKSGMPAGILRKVYNRGVAAWRTGHRPGTTPQQWGLARVNSFVTKSSGTWGKADKDLAAKVRG